MKDPILIIGAGLSGLAAAQTLRTFGENVLVVEKARGPGGRMSTRREEFSDGIVHFDHGAQFIRAHDKGFRQVMDAWERDRWVAPWRGTFVRIVGNESTPHEGRLRYAPGPGMNRVCQEYARRLGERICYQTRVSDLRQVGDHIIAFDQDQVEVGSFKAAICTAPGPQTADLLSDFRPVLAQTARATSYAPCLATMVAFTERPQVDWCAASIEDGPLSFVADDNARPGHQLDSGPSRWVLHATAAWSTAHLEEDPEVFASLMLEAFRMLPGVERIPEPIHLRGHRWRYALVKNSADSCYPATEGQPPVAIAGDWCDGPRVEAAWCTGVKAAAAIRNALA